MDEREKTWHGLRAASLSIVTGVGHLYIGEKRGYILLAIGATLLVVSRMLWPPAELFYVIFVIVCAFDAYSFVKRGYGLF